METTKLFEIASRQKFRYPFKGMVSTEDLWDLSVENLDLIFKTLNSQVKRSREESLLQTIKTEDVEVDMKIEIIKHIVSVKLQEKANREVAAEKKALKQKLLAIKAEKEDANLKNMSVEEIDKMLAEM